MHDASRVDQHREFLRLVRNGLDEVGRIRSVMDVRAAFEFADQFLLTKEVPDPFSIGKPRPGKSCFVTVEIAIGATAQKYRPSAWW